MANDTREDPGQYYPGGSVIVTPSERGGGSASTVAWDNVTDKPTAFNPTAHADTHKTGGTDELTPDDIGAAAAEHDHTVSDITDFPTSMAPTAHASTHATDGSDPIAPSAIGAATATALTSHTGNTSNPHNVTASQIGVATGATKTAITTGDAADTVTVTDKDGTEVSTTVPKQDTSLAVSGAYADAKVTGEKLSLRATVASLGNGVFRIADEAVDTTTTEVLY